jgi:ribosomal protein L11 methyltransferase
VNPLSEGPPTRWFILSVQPPDQDSRGILADIMVGLGGRAVLEEDGRLVTHLPEPLDLAAVTEHLERMLSEALGGAALDVRTGWQPHEDWADMWRRGLAPRRVSERIIVTPSWHPVEAGESDLVIVLDPGMAFGTAEHATTRGCLRLLERAVRRGDRVADVGAGSGIQAIAAARLGATDVLAVEGDPWAVDAARENVRGNGVEDVVRVSEAWVEASELPRLIGWRDGVVANIESGVLKRLLPGFRRALPAGSWLVLGGILAQEWDGMVRDVSAGGFTLEGSDRDEEWCAGLFRRSEEGGPAGTEPVRASASGPGDASGGR